MNGFRKILYILLIIALLFATVTMRNNSNVDSDIKKDVTSSAKEDEQVDNEVYNKLLEESRNEKIREKVINYLNSGKYYHIQEELVCKGKTYKSIQICNLEPVDYSYKNGEYRHYTHDMLYMYYSEDNNIGKMLDDSLKEKKAIINGSEEERKIGNVDCYMMPSIKYPTEMSKISFFRNENFGFMEEYCITALVCYDNKGNIETVKTFHGATGLHIKENSNGEIVWEVYIAEQMDYYWIVVEYKNNEKGIEGGPYSRGKVYNIYINDNEISEIAFMYESWDNLCADTSAWSEMVERKKYVKNNNISVYDIINCEELVSRINECQGNNTSIPREELVHIAREQFGKETIRHRLQCYEDPRYITKEGYIIYFGLGGMSYVKLTAEEYMDMETGEKEEYLDKNEKPLFIGGEVNPELVKELEKQ